MNIQRIPPKKIILSGGGIRAISHIGALDILERNGLLKNVKEYIGISAGAFVCFAYLIGYNIKEMILLCSKYDFSLIRNIDPEATFDFPNTFGIDNGINLVKLLNTLLRIKNISTNITFGELLSQTNKNFRCFCTDICSVSAREFSGIKTPTVKIIDGLRASMAIPGYFTPVNDPETGHLLVDGAVIHNSPLAFLPIKEQLGSISISFINECLEKESVTNLMDYFTQIFNSVSLYREKNLYMNKDNCILISNGHYPAWNFEASVEEREKMIEDGREAVVAFLGVKRNRVCRRYSVS